MLKISERDFSSFMIVGGRGFGAVRILLSLLEKHSKRLIEFCWYSTFALTQI